MSERLTDLLKSRTPHAIAAFWREKRRRLFINVRVDKKSEVSEILLSCWKNYKTDLHPIDRRMRVLVTKNIEGMGTENVRFMINELVRRFARNGTYLEVGSYRGSSLLSAALFNPSTRCVGIDNFSQFDGQGVNEKILKENLKKFPELNNIEFNNRDYKEVFREIKDRLPRPMVDVYLYDGDHSFESQLAGLSDAVPFLADPCFILVDDVNLSGASGAVDAFIKENPDFRSVLRIRTQGNGSQDWWNGLEIITRNTRK